MRSRWSWLTESRCKSAENVNDGAIKLTLRCCLNLPQEWFNQENQDEQHIEWIMLDYIR